MIWDEEQKVPYNTDFRVYFKCLEILRNPNILDKHKILGCTRLIYGEPVENIDKLNEYFAYANGKQKGTGEKCLDFFQDQNLIYSAFWQIYSIDLRTAQLSIKQFMALFDGLPDGTRLSEVIGIRLQKIPPRTKDNAEYINTLVKAKRAVSLELEQTATENPFASMAKFIANTAKKC